MARWAQAAKNIFRVSSSPVLASEKDKRPPDGDRLRCSSAGAPTPAGKQSDGDPAATRVAMRLRDCLRKAWAPEGRAISIMLVNKLKTALESGFRVSMTENKNCAIHVQ
ncbi:hypothetical protein EVJ26_06875 [Exiguobacterium sp. SH3S1]|nr:hypothetical protein EVJ26_06875 [Exiguobacterium sp. SH3S1]